LLCLADAIARFISQWEYGQRRIDFAKIEKLRDDIHDPEAAE